MSPVIEIVLNYLFIQFSILAFFAPFYLWYKVQRPHLRLRQLFENNHIEEFFSSRQANYLVFCWAAAEAVCWFVIPEFLLVLIIFLRVRNKRALLTYDIAGTAFGTIVGLFISRFSPFNVSHVPYITTNMVSQVKVWYSMLGSAALLFQPFSGVPYKVFVLNAYAAKLDLFGFLFLAIAIRIARYYIFYLIFAGLYPFLHRIISRNYIPIFLLWCFIFAAIFLKVYHNFGPGYVVTESGADLVKKALIFAKLKH